MSALHALHFWFVIALSIQAINICDTNGSLTFVLLLMEILGVSALWDLKCLKLMNKLVKVYIIISL